VIDFSQVMTASFDPALEMIDFSSTISVKISNLREFQEFNNYLIKKTFELVGDKRAYMIFDFNKIIIDPGLTLEVTDSIKEFYAKYLYPHGTAGYGKSFSRVTVKLSFKEIKEQEEHLFATREEAVDYVRMLVEESKQIKEEL